MADSDDIVFDRQTYLEMAKAWLGNLEIDPDPSVAEKIPVDRDEIKAEGSEDSLHPFEPELVAAAETNAIQLFQSCDQEADGQLSVEEAKRYLKDAPWALGYFHEQGALDWAALWRDYDANQDGLVDLSEFLRLYLQKLHPLLQAHREAHRKRNMEPAAKGKLAGAVKAVNGGSGEEAGEAARQAVEGSGVSTEEVAAISGQAAGVTVIHNGGGRDEAVTTATHAVESCGGSHSVLSQVEASILAYWEKARSANPWSSIRGLTPDTPRAIPPAATAATCAPSQLCGVFWYLFVFYV